MLCDSTIFVANNKRCYKWKW